MAKCPKCGSNRARFRREEAGSAYRSTYRRTGVKNSWVLPSGIKKGKRNVKYQTRGFCPDCGYSWESVGKVRGCLETILGLVVILIIIATFVAAVNDGNKKDSADSTLPSATNTSVMEEKASVWALEPTPLDSFDFYIDNDELHLKRYTGRDKKVFVASSYEYEGTVMNVVELAGTFISRSVDSVIIDDGITMISSYTFNSCGVKYLYLPATVAEFTGWNYFHDAEKIYYGGSEDQWNELCKYDRSRIDVKQIICNTSIDDLNKQ